MFSLYRLDAPSNPRAPSPSPHVKKHADTKFALIGGGVGVSNVERPPSSNVGNPAPRGGNSLEEGLSSTESKAQRGSSWRSDRDRLLNLLFKWKTGEAWREVMLVCGAETGWGGYGGLRSSCEVEVR